MVRKLKVEEMEINTSNKDPQKGLDWYEDKIRERLKDLRFEFKEEKDGVEIFKPRGLYKVYESDVEIERTPYHIRLKGSRLFLRWVQDLTEIRLMNS
jgi:hypothetical protein